MGPGDLPWEFVSEYKGKNLVKPIYALGFLTAVIALKEISQRKKNSQPNGKFLRMPQPITSLTGNSWNPAWKWTEIKSSESTIDFLLLTSFSIISSNDKVTGLAIQQNLIV